MNLPLDFHPLVQDDIQSAYDWYEQQRPGLGQDFLEELERVLFAITVNPARYGFADGDVREGLLKRFPYVVYYRELPGHLRVLAVYHASRNPFGWQSRG